MLHCHLIILTPELGNRNGSLRVSEISKSKSTVMYKITAEWSTVVVLTSKAMEYNHYFVPGNII